jgi:outer membrane lipoprotein SlyB
MKRLILTLALVAAAVSGCQLQEPTLPGTVISVVAVEPSEPEGEESAKYYEDPLVPEVAWQVEVRLKDGSAVTVTHQGPRRYEAGERVRVLFDREGALLL